MQLALTVLGKFGPSLTPDLMRTINDCRCNILECTSALLGGEVAGYFLVEGDWHQIARLENCLKTISRNQDLHISATRTEQTTLDGELVPYSIEIFGADRSGILDQLAAFLCEREIVVLRLNTRQQAAPQLTTTLFSAHLTVGIPSGVRIISLREEFLDFCDRTNIDAMLEPAKN